MHPVEAPPIAERIRTLAAVATPTHVSVAGAPLSGVARGGVDAAGRPVLLVKPGENLYGIADEVVVTVDLVAIRDTGGRDRPRGLLKIQGWAQPVPDGEVRAAAVAIADRCPDDDLLAAVDAAEQRTPPRPTGAPEPPTPTGVPEPPAPPLAPGPPIASEPPHVPGPSGAPEPSLVPEPSNVSQSSDISQPNATRPPNIDEPASDPEREIASGPQGVPASPGVGPAPRLLRVDVAQVVYLTGQESGVLDAENYLDASPDPFLDTAERILRHVNEWHRGQLALAIAHLLGEPVSADVWLWELDRYGATVWLAPDRLIRLPWPSPAASAAEMEHALSCVMCPRQG
ncbi:DUF2470 domain-containing protein [Microtetraspora malaysiensis]|uniref:DUF2470 domain-containing protein n=1 Tax=Microtetraspora malaysiensis TaxID=161358 RepID=UPI003D90F6D8